MRKRAWLILLLATGLASAGHPALAWDSLGHEVIARIAWEHMKPETREKAVALLKAAPPDAGLANLAPTDRELFLRAATWSDIVRDEAFPERHEKYHHSHWHYKNNYWEMDGNGQPRNVDRLQPLPENIVERLQAFERSVADPDRDAALRAVDLAWILHLGGDIHQPLHASSRVTATEPEGDRGGGLFKLAGDDLHWYWDSLLSKKKEFRRRWFEGKASRVERVAGLLQERYPRSSFAHRLEPGQYESWARAGLATSKSVVYQGVERGRTPSPRYQEAALEIVEPAVALAGYRLAEILERALGGGAR
jgi:hypothetical protein